MAKYGLQTTFINKIMDKYFGILPYEEPTTSGTDHLYIGLGLNQEGANINLETFDEIQNIDYVRANIIFSISTDGTCENVNEIIFSTSQSDWTPLDREVTMLGIFSDATSTEPLVVMPLPKGEKISIGETVRLIPKAVQFSLSDI